MLIIIALLVLVLYIYLGFKKPAIALITAAFIGGALFLLGAAEESVVMIRAPVIFFATLIAVLMSKREPEMEKWPQICAKWILYILIFLLF